MNYIGNKGIPGVYQKIINEIPVHKVYWELFAGGAAIGKLLPSAGTVKHYNDRNTTVLDRITVGSGEFKHSFDAIEILQCFGSCTDTFIFLDPPYLYSTRARTDYYTYELSDQQHSDLLAAVKLLKCNCMIIHPACELYDQALESWRSVQIKIRYNKKTSLEKLYMNYDKPQILQSSKYIGKDCWQRQGYKRKAERFIKKGLHIPFPEPTYITDMLNPSI